MSLFFLLLLSFRLVTGTWKKEVMTPRQHPAPCKEERFWGQMIHGARYVGTWPINIDGWFIGSSCLLPCRFTSAWRDDWPANGPLFSLSLSLSLLPDGRIPHIRVLWLPMHSRIWKNCFCWPRYPSLASKSIPILLHFRSDGDTMPRPAAKIFIPADNWVYTILFFVWFLALCPFYRIPLQPYTPLEFKLCIRRTWDVSVTVGEAERFFFFFFFFARIFVQCCSVYTYKAFSFFSEASFSGRARLWIIQEVGGGRWWWRWWRRRFPLFSSSSSWYSSLESHTKWKKEKKKKKRRRRKKKKREMDSKLVKCFLFFAPCRPRRKKNRNK